MTVEERTLELSGDTLAAKQIRDVPKCRGELVEWTQMSRFLVWKRARRLPTCVDQLTELVPCGPRFLLVVTADGREIVADDLFDLIGMSASFAVCFW